MSVPFTNAVKGTLERKMIFLGISKLPFHNSKSTSLTMRRRFVSEKMQGGDTPPSGFRTNRQDVILMSSAQAYIVLNHKCEVLVSQEG